MKQPQQLHLTSSFLGEIFVFLYSFDGDPKKAAYIKFCLLTTSHFIPTVFITSEKPALLCEGLGVENPSQYVAWTMHKSAFDSILSKLSSKCAFCVNKNMMMAVYCQQQEFKTPLGWSFWRGMGGGSIPFQLRLSRLDHIASTCELKIQDEALQD